MESLIKTLHAITANNYAIKELPGILPFSQEQKNNFLLKQILMRIAAGVGELATLSEPEKIQNSSSELHMKDCIAKLFINVLLLAKLQNLDEELLYADIQRLLVKNHRA